MKPKAVIKITADILMTSALILLMGYHLWGEVFHEWIGVGMFILFIAHHILNGNWHKTLFKGKYNALRILSLVIDILVLLSMLAQMYSGIVMSRHALSFLPSFGGMALARRLHILGAYWGFILISLHLGLHWSMLMGIFRKMAGIKTDSKLRSAVLFCISLIIAGYGVWVLGSRDLLTYLFLKTEFVFLDYGESKVLFCTDYTALMGLCIFAAHYTSKLFRRLQRPCSQPLHTPSMDKGSQSGK